MVTKQDLNFLSHIDLTDLTVLFYQHI